MRISDRQLLCRSGFLLLLLLKLDQPPSCRSNCDFGIAIRDCWGVQLVYDGGGVGGVKARTFFFPHCSSSIFPAHLVCCLLLLFILLHQTLFLNHLSNCYPVQFPNERCRKQKQFTCRSVLQMDGACCLGSSLFGNHFTLHHPFNV